MWGRHRVESEAGCVPQGALQAPGELGRNPNQGTLELQLLVSYLGRARPHAEPSLPSGGFPIHPIAESLCVPVGVGGRTPRLVEPILVETARGIFALLCNV